MAEATATQCVTTAKAMATTVTVRLVPDRAGADLDVGAAELLAKDALEVFALVERSCTRFDPSSPLMRANAEPNRWHRVPAVLFAALQRAQRAHVSTNGRFDPRVLADLVELGYSTSLPFAGGEVLTAAVPARRSGAGTRAPWRPGFRFGRSEVNLGGEPVDLGGIGKGLAVGWASERLRSAAPHHLVDAGGDSYCSGEAPEGGNWRIAVEDATGGDEPVAVLSLRDAAVATSSTRIRRWHAGVQPVHHLIDPSTGRPGGAGLLAVTVVGSEPANAEVWSKALFLAGADDVASEARRRGLAALWVNDDGSFATSPAMERFVLWRRN